MSLCGDGRKTKNKVPTRRYPWISCLSFNEDFSIRKELFPNNSGVYIPLWTGTLTLELHFSEINLISVFLSLKCFPKSHRDDTWSNVSKGLCAPLNPGKMQIIIRWSHIVSNEIPEWKSSILHQISSTLHQVHNLILIIQCRAFIT